MNSTANGSPPDLLNHSAIKAGREALGLSCDQVAQSLGLSASAVTNWESPNGSASMLLKHLVGLSLLYGCPADALINRNAIPIPTPAARVRTARRRKDAAEGIALILEHATPGRLVAGMITALSEDLASASKATGVDADSLRRLMRDEPVDERDRIKVADWLCIPHDDLRPARGRAKRA